MTNELMDVRSALAGLFYDLEGGRSSWSPAVDIEATDKEYIFSAAMPGLEKDAFKVQVHEGLLTIRGDRRESHEEKGRNFIRRELVTGTFTRSFALPEDAQEDGVQAGYKNGILRVSVPRAEKPQPKRVDVKVE